MNLEMEHFGLILGVGYETRSRPLRNDARGSETLEGQRKFRRQEREKKDLENFLPQNQDCLLGFISGYSTV